MVLIFKKIQVNKLQEKAPLLSIDLRNNGAYIVIDKSEIKASDK